MFVNDYSPDDSWSVLKGLSSEYPYIKSINLRKNSSQHNAIMAGLHFAQGEVVVMMDDDLQHSPKYILELYQKIKDGSDVCYANFHKKHHASWKLIGSSFNNYVATVLLKKDRDLYLSSFKAISQEIKNEIIKYDGPYVYLDGLILDVTQNTETITVEHNKREEGKGNYTLFNSISLWLKMATNFSVLPLRIASILGFIFSILGLLLALYFVIFKLFFTTDLPTGWTSIVVSVLVLGGTQLITLGIIGEYIGRTYLKINKKSQFTIKEKLNT